MTFLLPLVAFALAVAAPFLLRTERGKLDLGRLTALVVLLIGAGAVIFKAAPAIDRSPALIGLVLGTLACVLGAWGGGLGFGVAAASALHFLPATSLPSAGMALAAGAGLGALAIGGEMAALAAILVVASDLMGMRLSQEPAAAFIGSQIGVAITVGAFLSAWVPDRFRLTRPIVVAAIVMLAGRFLVQIVGGESFSVTIAMGAVAGVVIHLLMPDEEGEAARVGLAAFIGIGVATAAFSFNKGAGMAFAFLAAYGVLLSVGNRRAALALGPVVGLVMFRVLREAGTGATRALEIGQHYTLLALVLGLFLPLLPTDWLTARTKGHAAGIVLWGIVAIAAAPLVVVTLGMRGGIGFLIGLGVVGLVQALRGGEGTVRSLSPLALGGGMAGATILAITWLGDETALTRDQKIWLFIYAVGAMTVIAALLAVVGRTKKEAVTS